MKLTGWAIFALLFVGLRAGAAEELPVWWAAPAFALTDQEGRAVTNEDLRGKPWVVNFIFTRCPGPCPLMTERKVALAKAVAAANARFVSISVDPLHDKPAVLKEYARVRGATDPRMLFLTGKGKDIYQLVKTGFKLSAEPASETSPILHDERFLLIDGAGDVRGAYHIHDAEAMTKLAADLTTLAGNPSLARFPVINASLNATAGIFLCIGMMLIKARRVRAHAAFMIAAVVTSTAFLACYVTFHYMKAGKFTPFPAGSWRPVYLTVLISHTILAVAVVPLVVMTLRRAWRREWALHRRIARPTFWIWLYVSVTGVVVYWMLYQLAPRIAGVG